MLFINFFFINERGLTKSLASANFTLIWIKEVNIRCFSLAAAPITRYD